MGNSKNAFEKYFWNIWVMENNLQLCLKVFKALSSLKKSLAFTKHSLKELNCVLNAASMP